MIAVGRTFFAGQQWLKETPRTNFGTKANHQTASASSSQLSSPFPPPTHYSGSSDRASVTAKSFATTAASRSFLSPPQVRSSRHRLAVGPAAVWSALSERASFERSAVPTCNSLQRDSRLTSEDGRRYENSTRTHERANEFLNQALSGSSSISAGTSRKTTKNSHTGVMDGAGGGM